MVDRRVKVSDLSDTLADKRIYWAFGSRQFQIDLTTAELEEFEKVLAPYVAASRPSRRKRKTTTASRKTAAKTRTDNKAKTSK